jgi:hypothetical protein
MSWGSSVSIVSDYRLDDQGSIPGGRKEFVLWPVSRQAEAHPASYTIGTGGPYPGGKRGWGMMLTTYPHLMLRSRMSRSYIFSPPWHQHGITGQLLHIIHKVNT